MLHSLAFGRGAAGARRHDQGESAAQRPTAGSAMDKLEDVLISLRRILRVTDTQAKTLARESRLTVSQLVILQAIRDAGELTIGAIAKEVTLSQATVTSIVDRLERVGLVRRERGSTDKRKVYVRLTDEGLAVVARAPAALHERFAARFEKLDEWEQNMILASLQRVAMMMDAAQIDAAPLLDVGVADREPDVPG
jgi:DNA-binding MarR family transcriptional regulator